MVLLRDLENIPDATYLQFIPEMWIFLLVQVSID